MVTVLNKIKHLLPALWLVTIAITLSVQTTEGTGFPPTPAPGPASAPATTSFWSNIGSSIGSTLAWNSINSMLASTGKSIAKTVQIHPKATAAIGLGLGVTLICCACFYGYKKYYGEQDQSDRWPKTAEIRISSPRSDGLNKFTASPPKAPAPSSATPVAVAHASTFPSTSDTHAHVASSSLTLVIPQAKLHEDLMEIMANLSESESDARNVIERVAQLIKAGLDVNTIDKHRNTALIHAVKAQHYDLVRYLLTVPKVNVNAIDRYGMTALMYVVQCREITTSEIEIVSELLAANADVKIKMGDKGMISGSSMNALELATKRCAESHNKSNPCKLEKFNYAQIVELLKTATLSSGR